MGQKKTIAFCRLWWNFFPLRLAAENSEATEFLPGNKRFDLSVDKVSQSNQIHTSLCLGTHDEISPDSGSSDGVVQSELHRSIDADDLLDEIVWLRIHGVWPCCLNCEPPSKRLISIMSGLIQS